MVQPASCSCSSRRLLGGRCQARAPHAGVRHMQGRRGAPHAACSGPRTVEVMVVVQQQQAAVHGCAMSPTQQRTRGGARRGAWGPSSPLAGAIPLPGPQLAGMRPTPGQRMPCWGWAGGGGGRAWWGGAAVARVSRMERMGGAPTSVAVGSRLPTYTRLMLGADSGLLNFFGGIALCTCYGDAEGVPRSLPKHPPHVRGVCVGGLRVAASEGAVREHRSTGGPCCRGRSRVRLLLC